MNPNAAPGQEEIDRAAESKMTVPLFLFVAFSLFVLGMAVLAPENTRNAREIAQLLGGIPHRPIVMKLMLLALLASAALGACAAYAALWWRGRHRNACLAGAAAALLLGILLYWSPQVVRMTQPVFAP